MAQDTLVKTVRYGSDPYDSVSANGWYVVDGGYAIAGPFCDKAVAEKHLDLIKHAKRPPVEA